MRFWANIKSYFKSPMHHEIQSGGYGSNPFYQQSFWNSLFGMFANTRINYAREVGDLQQSRLIMAAVNFLGRSLPEAELQVVKLQTNGVKKLQLNHKLPELIYRPNPFYTGDLFFKAFGLSWLIAGNVYFYKVRNQLGEVIQLWYLPHHQIEPRWNDGDFITYYAYQVDGKEHHLDPKDVIHFRNGIDPQNPRLGLSEMASGLREIFTDNEYANFSALLAKNNGVSPFAISPKNDTQLDKSEIARLEDSVHRKTSGDERGKPFISTRAFEIYKTGFSPLEMDLSKLRRVPEETISSLTGIPAVVLQFGAGLERSTYSNYEEARKSAYENVVVPLWRYIQSELTHQLLSDFDNSNKYETNFDISNVRVLQDDENKLYTRLGVAYRTGFMKRSEVRSKANLPVEASDEVYFVEPKSVTEPKQDENNQEE